MDLEQPAPQPRRPTRVQFADSEVRHLAALGSEIEEVDNESGIDSSSQRDACLTTVGSSAAPLLLCTATRRCSGGGYTQLGTGVYELQTLPRDALSSCEAESCSQAMEAANEDGACCSPQALDGLLAPGREFDEDPPQQRYRLVRELGRGAFGAVWLCDVGKERRAVKFVVRSEAGGEDCTAAANAEAERTRKASAAAGSELVPEFFGASAGRLRGSFDRLSKAELQVSENVLMIVTAFVDGVSAGALARSAPLPELAARVVLRDVCMALARLHAAGIIHRDVKGDNILISKRGRCFLCDFGVSRIDSDGGQGRKERMTVCGTAAYMAPEIVGDEAQYNEKVDVWSLGMTAIELGTGRTPWHSKRWALANIGHMVHLLRNLPASPTRDRKSWRDILDESNYAESFAAFVGRCTEHDPAARAEAAELLASDFLSQDEQRTASRGLLASCVRLVANGVGDGDYVPCSGEIKEPDRFLSRLRRFLCFLGVNGYLK